MDADQPDDIFDLAYEFTREIEDEGQYRIEEYVATGERRMDGSGVSLEPAIEQILTHKDPQITVGPDRDGILNDLKRMEATLGDNPLIISNEQYREIQQYADPGEAQVTYSDDPDFHEHSLVSRDDAWEALETFLDSLDSHVAHLDDYELNQRKDRIRSYFDSALEDGRFIIPAGDRDLVRKGGSLDASGFLDWDDYPLEFEQKPFGASILYGSDQDQITITAIDASEAVEQVETGEDPHYEIQEYDDSYQLVADTHQVDGGIEVEYMDEHNALVIQTGDEVLDYERMPDVDPASLETSENNGVYQVRIEKTQ
ncbi:MAG: hypothetical protein SVU32_06405 [Candidatus Nanohaloarchaea archaeon]|nr:hypothetical protein [Candidatus Nanohaloarchaea archaeon]